MIEKPVCFELISDSKDVKRFYDTLNSSSFSKEAKEKIQKLKEQGKSFASKK